MHLLWFGIGNLEGLFVTVIADDNFILDLRKQLFVIESPKSFDVISVFVDLFCMLKEFLVIIYKQKRAQIIKENNVSKKR